MKVKFIRPIEAAPSVRGRDDLGLQEVIVYRRKCIGWPVGAEYEHPEAWRLVRMGVAEPADTECEDELARRNITADVIARARASQDRIALTHSEFVDEAISREEAKQLQEDDGE